MKKSLLHIAFKLEGLNHKSISFQFDIFQDHHQEDEMLIDDSAGVSWRNNNDNVDDLMTRQVPLTASSLEAILTFIYTRAKIEITKDNVQALLAAASYLEMSQIMDKCSKFLEDNFANCDDIVEVRNLAEVNGCKELVAKAERFVGDNFNKIVSSPEFVHYPLANVATMLSLNTLEVPEEDVYNAVNIWLNHDYFSRRFVVPSLLQHVRIPLMSPVSSDYISNEIMPWYTFLLNFLNSFKRYSETEPMLFSLRNDNPRDYQNKVMLSIGRKGEKWRDGEEDKGEYFLQIVDFETGTCTHLKDIPKAISVSILLGYRSYMAANEDKIYIMGYAGEVALYEPKKDKWTLKKMIIRRSCQSEFAFGDNMYAIGGYTHLDAGGVEYVNTVDVYNFAEDSYKILPNMPMSILSADVVSHEGNIYVIGIDGAQVYITEENRWEELPSMPIPSVVKLAVLDGIIYAVSSKCSIIESFDGEGLVQFYNPRMKTWYALPNINGENEPFEKIIGRNGALYAVRKPGQGSEGSQGGMKKYDLKTNEWEEINSFEDTHNICLYKKKYLSLFNTI